MDKREIITNSAEQTKKLGLEMAEKILSGEAKERVICLSGDLGAGKTTFTQGLLEGLGAQGPYTSPTFNIVKEYDLVNSNKVRKNKANNFQFFLQRRTSLGLAIFNFQTIFNVLISKFKNSDLIQNSKFKIQKVYHIDAYRIESTDMLELGWEEMISRADNVIIVEWAERIRDIIPIGAVWMEFEWKDESERRIKVKN